MSPDGSPNTGHSVFQRLLNYAKSHDEDFNMVLSRYGIERLLYRLSISPYADRFVLKGASLFLVWTGQNVRPTRDADFLGFGDSDTSHVASVFAKLCSVSGEDVDGVRFLVESVMADDIRDNQEYAGVRVRLRALLHTAEIAVQVDIGFGDAVTPGIENALFPTLLEGMPAPAVRVYPRYTMVAEKFEAMVRLGIANSRMKDFYDVWLLSRLFEFDGKLLAGAVRNTFERRSTPPRAGRPMAFSEEFTNDRQKQAQWRAFVRKSRSEAVSGDLGAAMSDIAAFLMPVMEAMRDDRTFESSWPKGGPWR